MNVDPESIDPVRRRSVRDAPEERVRQAFLRFLIEDRGIPRGLIRVESGVAGGKARTPGRAGRADIVVHDRCGRPWMVVECKAPDVPLDQSVWNQAARYNRKLSARYLLVTNGREHLCAGVARGETEYLTTFPPYPAAASAGSSSSEIEPSSSSS
jgi:hypothetical protein